MSDHDLRFKRTVMGHWRRNGRHGLPWRKTTDPYAILVSEIMLQQTQVDRVVPYFISFLKRFPDVRTLARARTANVLASWQGLGYNRRALMLQRCAKVITSEHGGRVPDESEALTALPGLGRYTAGAVLVFAFDRPYPLIETNIRRVYLHHFFSRRKNVPDSAVLPVVTRHLSFGISPRTWFAALMDYGSWLALQVPNPNRRSREYIRQGRFEGSERQLRGRILRDLLKEKAVPLRSLRRKMADGRFDGVVARMEREGFVKISRGRISCA